MDLQMLLRGIDDLLLKTSFLEQTILNLSMNAGLQTFQCTEKYKEQRIMVIRNVVVMTMQESIIPIFQVCFEEKVSKHQQIIDEEERRRFFEELKKNIADFISFSTRFFVLIVNKLVVKFPSEEIRDSIEMALSMNTKFNSCDPSSNSTLKSVFFTLFPAYASEKMEIENTLKAKLVGLNMEETSGMSAVKNAMKKSNFYQREKEKLQTTIKAFNRGGDIKKVILALLSLSQTFEEEMTRLYARKFKDADDRQFLNINLIAIFNMRKLYTICQFIGEYYLNVIIADGAHLITTLLIAFCKIESIIGAENNPKESRETTCSSSSPLGDEEVLSNLCFTTQEDLDSI